METSALSTTGCFFRFIRDLQNLDILDLRLILVQHGEPCGVPVAAFIDDGLREEAVKSKAESLRGAARPDGALQESHFHS